ncbi:protein NUCLEAR FUSION DEFECTIVE 6, chloroplastic/mitochondrial-like [Olea europaea var. sylvestris]|uniref:protein NUCLEAR FUSION DEFECTIVE 6, chloroplastic/mitochondrial-like n=1 Tax=Olea europaea var. sylvestris TaxID=158386 RepID=UPI000C1D0BF9|nr:protein NUCLEAR FUSION DEFECTIVE 6, chloroplastic/mitochondrial-like [Olea europaea var. sylvestris]
MASSRVISRSYSRLQTVAAKLNKNSSTSIQSSPFKSASESSVNKRFSIVSRLPVELSCVETMIPLHSAIASARLKSSLSIESQKWGLVPQGISMPL